MPEGYADSTNSCELRLRTTPTILHQETVRVLLSFRSSRPAPHIQVLRRLKVATNFRA